MGLKRYETLDALRGVAAMVVVAYHMGNLRLEAAAPAHGYLAVDFFFILSGFVIAHAYESALREHRAIRSFIVKRVIRLYPLAMLGAALGVFVLLAKWLTFPAKVATLPDILVAGGLNMLVLPDFISGPAASYDLFPSNGPLWSLFFELLINVLWAWLGVRLRTSVLATVTLASGLVLIVLGAQLGTLNIGFDVMTFIGGLARVCFGFSLGVLIYRLHPNPRTFSGPMGPILLGLMLVLVLAAPWNSLGEGPPWWDLCCVLAIMPVIVLLGIRLGTAGYWGEQIGKLSYPVYVLHFPILLVASGLHQSFLAKTNVHILSAISVAIILLLGCLAPRYYDNPARRALSAVARRNGLLGPLPNQGGEAVIDRAGSGFENGRIADLREA